MSPKIILLLSTAVALSGCIPFEDSCFSAGVSVNLTLQNQSERDVQVFAYGQLGYEDMMQITTNPQDDQLSEIMSLDPRLLFVNNIETENIGLGILEKGTVSSFLVEVLLDDGRVAKFAGWPKEYQTLPDVDRYELGYVRNSKNVLVSSFPQTGEEKCTLNMKIIVNSDELVQIQKG